MEPFPTTAYDRHTRGRPDRAAIAQVQITSKRMKIKSFEDTDTALVELSAAPVMETKELSEDVYLDLDAQGLVVGITIEHASTRGDMSEMSFFRLPRKSADHQLHPAEVRPAV